MTPPRYDALGLPVDALSYDQAVERLCDLATTPGPTRWACAVNPEKVMLARSDPELQSFISRAALAFPDGIGVVLACRMLYRAQIMRTPGADLMESVCAQSATRNITIFFFGSSEEVNAAAVAELQQRYPGMRAVGRQHGYLPPEEYDALVQRINDTHADLLVLALGSPKQERWIARYAPALRVNLCLGVGGTLDTLTGRVKRAPALWRRLYLEWFYRLARQPWRVWRQRRIFYYAALVGVRYLQILLTPHKRRTPPTA
ncbi:MAG: WecB/TagA/CpsF family glycosyltransferase [Planctomycetia bacterium]|nr:WecB/TagA/CpsF family glycosyltransferase [Planctomycetia bacterium]